MATTAKCNKSHGVNTQGSLEAASRVPDPGCHGGEFEEGFLGEGLCKLFHIEEPIAKGIALGSSSHAIGTAKAMEMGEIEGAMSSLSIAVAGILTVIGASVFASVL